MHPCQQAKFTVELTLYTLLPQSTGVLVKMLAKYLQIIFFIIALIITVLNVYNRFFTKKVIFAIFQSNLDDRIILMIYPRNVTQNI